MATDVAVSKNAGSGMSADEKGCESESGVVRTHGLSLAASGAMECAKDSELGRRWWWWRAQSGILVTLGNASESADTAPKWALNGCLTGV
jgi:hypothetical protein